MVRVAEDARRLRPERVPPHNLEAEESVLGSMMLSTEAVAEVIEEIKPDDFYRSAHRIVFEALVHLYGRGEPTDQIAAVEELKRRGTLEDVGGPLRVHELVEQVPTPASARHYAKIVHELALLRRLILAASEIMTIAYETPEDPERVADRAEELIYSVARRDQKDEVVLVRSLVDQTMEELEHIHQRESAYSGIPSGFRDLDELLSGLQKGNLIVVAARPGVGKSSFVTNLVRNVTVGDPTVTGVPSALFSLEMSRWEIGMRLLCGEARVPWDRVRAARVSGDDWSRIVEAAETLHDVPLYIVDAGNVTILDIRAKARRLRSTRHLGLIVVDYLQLMSHHGRADNRQQEVAEISRGLKLLAKELDIPVIAVSQLNRDPERRQDKRPQLSDLRECVTGDTLVQLTDGRRVPIAELVGTTPKVWAMSSQGEIVPARADRVWSVGARPVREMRLASGRHVRATDGHRFYSLDGWRRLEELRPGDRLALARRLPEPSIVEVWPDHAVALLGHLLGRGSYVTSGDVRYTAGAEANARQVASAAELMGSSVRHLEARGDRKALLVSEGSGRDAYGVDSWLTKLGVLGQQPHEKRIPGAVFRLGERQIALLLRHLWASAGIVSDRSSIIFLPTASPGLARDVAALLLRLGVVARVRAAKHGRVRTTVTVDVSGPAAQLRFLETVGGFGPLAGPVARLATSVAAGRRIGTEEAFEPVGPLEVPALQPERELAALRAATAPVAPGSGQPAPSPAGQPAMFDDATADRRSDLVWDRVVEIVPAGTEDVFDLTVPGPASWLADGIVSHNSGAIEQDADIVMFIHRDDMSEDVEKKNVAELIVAKHRNGPTGNIKLQFNPNLTQFRNYAPGP